MRIIEFLIDIALVEANNDSVNEELPVSAESRS